MALTIRRAELQDGRIADVRLKGDRITEVGDSLPSDGAPEIDAAGGLLLPGLHDHHVHLAATAAARNSVRCGPPEVETAEQLASALSQPGDGWLRGTGYHDSIAGPIDRDGLDRIAADRPIRVQHRSGRLWVFNSVGLKRLLDRGLAAPPGLEREGGRWTGRLYDDDIWLRQALGGAPPDLATIGAELARFGVTGVTDMSPGNDACASAYFGHEHRRESLPQRVLMAGRLDLNGEVDPAVQLGPVKLHLHEAHLPDFVETVTDMATSHARGRAVAVHCVTEVELVFALAALREAGTVAGDRVEHASVASDALVENIAELGLAVVAQPNFVAERGDTYLADIDKSDWPHLYRLRAFKAAGVTLAGGSDTPFGRPDPWAAMRAAVSRRTARGRPFCVSEALTPEDALALFLADPIALATPRKVTPGALADLGLLNAPWAEARERLSADLVRATVIAGRLVYERVDKTPP